MYIERYPEAEHQIKAAVTRLTDVGDEKLAPLGTPHRLWQLKAQRQILELKIQEARVAIGK